MHFLSTIYFESIHIQFDWSMGNSCCRSTVRDYQRSSARQSRGDLSSECGRGTDSVGQDSWATASRAKWTTCGRAVFTGGPRTRDSPPILANRTEPVSSGPIKAAPGALLAVLGLLPRDGAADSQGTPSYDGRFQETFGTAFAGINLLRLFRLLGSNNMQLEMVTHWKNY